MADELQLDLTISADVEVVDQPDGSVLIRRGSATSLVTTRRACLLLGGICRNRLYELGPDGEGEIYGEQPAKPIADVEAGRKTNHAWRWCVRSIEDYKRRKREARDRAQRRRLVGV